ALLLAVVAREGAEAAVLDADVGEIDVAVHDVGDGVAHVTPAQLVGGEREREQVAPGGGGQALGLGYRDLDAVQRAGQDAADVGCHAIENGDQATSVARAHAIPSRGRQRRRATPRAAAVPRRGTRRASRTRGRSPTARGSESPGSPWPRARRAARARASR